MLFYMLNSFKGNNYVKKIIGKNACILPGASVENSVIGEEAIVKYPIQIRNSLVFPGVQVTSKNDIDSAIKIIAGTARSMGLEVK